ncbi:MAG TPA: Tim44-like domain-containing protein [Burkholderiales bacterium]|nr:Tim44-like domain-containing protein [Burkholderiales bacterium]
MGKWLLAAIILFSGGALVAVDAEAKRFGGARSSGVQRNVTTPPAATPAKPAQQAAPQQAAPVAGATAGAAGAAKAAPAGMAKWFPMLGGLALGGMLGWLLASNGGSFLLLVLLAIAAFLVVRALSRRAAPAQTMQYAGGGRETVRMEPGSGHPGSGSGADLPARGTASLPAGFDADGFLRGAQMNFARLQMANDRGNLDDIREFTTPEMFDSLAKDVHERGGAAQQTDVAGLNAELLEVAQEGGNYWASVHFSGTVREAPGAAAEPFAEVWNLVKPADGSTGWLLAGIQQVN